MSSAPDDGREYAYVHRQSYKIPPNNLPNGLARCVGQIGDGVMDPVRGVFGGLQIVGQGDPIFGIKRIVSKSLTGVEKVATAPRMITNGLFNTVLGDGDKQDADEKMETIAVRWLLPNEDDFTENNKILGFKSGDVWPENERGRPVLLRHTDDAHVIAVTLKGDIEPTHIASGLAGGLKQITFSVARPLVGLADMFYRQPKKCFQQKRSVKSIAKGVGIGLRNTVESPFLIVHDVLNGSKKIVEGVFNTPNAVNMVVRKGFRFNSWMGWCKAYHVANLKCFPGEVGDMLCIQQVWYSHVMIKIDDEHVIHRSGESNFLKRGSPSKIEIQGAKAGILKSSLQDIKNQYKEKTMTVLGADYCIAKHEDKYFVFKKRAKTDIIQMAQGWCDETSGWELFGKNCEHFCFEILFGVKKSFQIQRIFSLNKQTSK